MKKKRRKKTKSFSTNHKLNSLQNELLTWRNKNAEVASLKKKLYELRKQVDTHKKIPSSRPGRDPYLSSLLLKINELKIRISKLPSEDQIAAKIKFLNGQITLVKSEKIITPLPRFQSFEIEVEWDSVSFQDNFISILYNGHWLKTSC